MGINFGAISTVLIAVAAVVILVVGIAVLAGAGKGNVRKAVGQSGVVIIGVVLIALAIGGAGLALGTNIVTNIFGGAPAA